MLKVGMFIQNRYEILSKIGSGGMADVYKAKDHKLNRCVAVKVLKKEFRDDREFISKFRVEAQSAAGLTHANIVNIYDVGEESGIYYIVMELVEGITLKQYIKNKGRLSAREATSIALQISAGLEAAHNNGIIHRDIKPQNIIIATDGRVKVADFGIARASSSNTINSSVMGSVHYSSPEQSRGGYSDEKSDIYSLGITMYEMLTGHVPFDGDSAVAVAIKHLQEEMHGPKEEVPETPFSTNEIVLKCTQKSPDRRYPNMTEVIRDLRESLVNPDGNFVTQASMDTTSRTIIVSKEELSQINAERVRPSYDENLDVGAAATLQEDLQEGSPKRTYQPGSYYHMSGYQEMDPGRGEAYPEEEWGEDYPPEDENIRDGYDPYYDAYDNPDDYKIEDDSFRLNQKESGRRHLRDRNDDQDREVGLNPKLEKAVTIGGILVAVIIGCIFLALLANAFGLLKFGKRAGNDRKQNSTKTETEVDAQETKESETERKQQVSVPELLGRQGEDVQELLERYGLSGKKIGEAPASDYASQYTAGQVCEQFPKSGTMADRGTVVEYKVIETGVEFLLDDLTNADQSTAQAFLLTKGLQCEIDTTKYSDTVQAGYVISTTPAANATVKPGDTVTLFISQGPDPATMDPENLVELWDLHGYTKDRATEAVTLIELVPEYKYEASNEVPKDCVISQSAEAGVPVPRGSTVTLVISTGPSGDAQEDQQAQGSAEAGTWTCDASLAEPNGYNGESVRITLVQSGEERTIFEGTTTFPYRLQTAGEPEVSTGTAYVYVLDNAGNVISKIEYAGVQFTKKEE